MVSDVDEISCGIDSSFYDIKYSSNPVDVLTFDFRMSPNHFAALRRSNVDMIHLDIATHDGSPTADSMLAATLSWTQHDIRCTLARALTGIIHTLTCKHHSSILL